MINNNNSISKLLNARQVADILGVSRTQAYRLMETELTSVRFGERSVRVRPEDLERYIEGHTCKKVDLGL